MATYRDTWWYPNYIEYENGSKTKKTWPTVQEQYRCPDKLYDLRYYKLPVEHNDMLYYRLPALGKPEYRGRFQDKPFTVPRHYPEMDPRGQPKGYFGRQYYEDNDTGFKYQGRHKDSCRWLDYKPVPIRDGFRPI